MKRRGFLGLLAGVGAALLAPVRWAKAKVQRKEAGYVFAPYVPILREPLIETFTVRHDRYAYPLAVLERVVADLRELADKDRCLGTMMPEYPNVGTVIKLSEVSHQIVGAYLEDGKIEVEVKVLDTPSGKVLRGFIEEDVAEFALVGVGRVLNGVEIQDDYKVLQVAWCAVGPMIPKDGYDAVGVQS